MNVAYSIRSIAFDVIERRVNSRKATSFLLKVTTLGVDTPHDTSHLASRAHRSIQVLSSATVDATVTPPVLQYTVFVVELFECTCRTYSRHFVRTPRGVAPTGLPPFSRVFSPPTKRIHLSCIQ